MQTLIADEEKNFLVEIRSQDGSLTFHTAPDKSACLSFAAAVQKRGDRVKYYRRAEDVFDHVRWLPTS